MDMPASASARGPALRRADFAAGRVHHLIATTVAKAALFSDFQAGCEAIRAFRQPTVLGDACLLAWVLMPDHCHWLLQSGERMGVDKAVARMKSASAVRVNRTLGRGGSVWEPAFRDRVLHMDDDLRAVARAIVANPLRCGLVERIGDYPFWDCVWL